MVISRESRPVRISDTETIIIAQIGFTAILKPKAKEITIFLIVQTCTV